MIRDEILAKLKVSMEESSQENTNWDNVTDESTIESLGFDSLSILDLIYDIQQEFSIEFEAEELAAVRTIGELVTFLEEKNV